MARRRLLTVDELPLIGGAPCLDLVNTTGARESDAPRERLLTYEDLLTWTRRADLLDDSVITRLRRQAGRRPGDAERALGEVCRLREELYRLFRPLAEGEPPPADAVAQLGGWWRAERQRRELGLRDGEFALDLRVADDELDPMRWPLIASAVELLTSDGLSSLKRCAECDWLFVDETKNGSRTWCKKQCGDRARARRHYARKRRARESG